MHSSEGRDHLMTSPRVQIGRWHSTCLEYFMVISGFTHVIGSFDRRKIHQSTGLTSPFDSNSMEQTKQIHFDTIIRLYAHSLKYGIYSPTWGTFSGGGGLLDRSERLRESLEEDTGKNLMTDIHSSRYYGGMQVGRKEWRWKSKIVEITNFQIEIARQRMRNREQLIYRNHTVLMWY